MPIIEHKYKKLNLTDEYLNDSLLMILAWKKSHQYIRTTNWYADNFELDRSTISLAENAKQWCESISNEDESLEFEKLQLVPAPKTSSWGFHKNKPANVINTECLYWYPIECKASKKNKKKKKDKKQHQVPNVQLRPLAHIGIREQTMMTLVMMCLADTVETKQGDPATEFELVHEAKVANYGNRLYCSYDEKGFAEHSYGATTIYSKYFIDNKRFLERPYYFARKAREELNVDKEVILVELDLSKFFDSIKRKVLCKKIRSLQPKENNSGTKFVDNLLKCFTNWKWSEQALGDYRALCSSNSKKKGVPKGIPQGLVAGGFFANIYLLDFDQAMMELIGKSLSEEREVTLIDYCRYVDDMRFVVSMNKEESFSQSCDTQTFLDNIQEKIEEFVTNQFKKSQIDGLALNSKKTKLEIYKPRLAGISGELTKLQHRLSGPVPFNESQEYLGQIEALLSITGKVEPYEQGGKCNLNTLALIEQSHMDVRSDTLKRFAANKLARVLRTIRNFTTHPLDNNDKPMPCDWDFQQERLARRLIACWSEDPSLVLLLKKGLELFPCKRLIAPVLQQLCYKIEDAEKLRESHSDSKRDKYPTEETVVFKVEAVAKYCLSEVFRHAATTIHRLTPKYIPAHADVDAFFEILQDAAVKQCQVPAMSESEEFDLLKQQARFLLLARLDTTLSNPSGDSNIDVVVQLTKGFRHITFEEKIEEINDGELATNILVARQLMTDVKPLVRALANLLNRSELSEKTKKSVIDKIASHDNDLCQITIRHARQLKLNWVKLEPIKELIRHHCIDIYSLSKPLDKVKGYQSLLRLIRRVDNPFANEVMALKLTLSMLNKKELFSEENKEKLISLNETKVWLRGCTYSTPPTFDVFNAELDVDLGFIDAECTNKTVTDASVLQRVARCIRSVVIGSQDWTGFSTSFAPKEGYRGIRTNEIKRSVGMMNTPQSIFGESAQISHWLTTLLSKLLIWPGISVNNQGYKWPSIWSVESVINLIEQRLETLKMNYCQQVRTPALIESVFLDWKEAKQSLTVAMVQSKLPHVNDFKNYGLMLEDTSFRAKHRRHIADVAALVCKHIDAQRTSTLERNERGKQVDLIVWPELAVQYDDIDILIDLSRKTHSIIFAGLGFLKQENVEGPNNCGVWIVPAKTDSNQKELIRFQGKQNMMKSEVDQIKPWRPYQLMLELKHPKFPDKKGFVITGSICFDATDISLSADLRNKSNAYIVAALNKDVNTFDTMIDALHYHMFQPVILVNTGVYGGSCAKAPYLEPHHRLIAHSHGNDQVTINTFEMNMFDFRRDNIGKSMQSGNKVKSQPAGL